MSKGSMGRGKVGGVAPSAGGAPVNATPKRRRPREIGAVGAWHSADPVEVVHVPGRNAPCPCGSGRKAKRCPHQTPAAPPP